MRTIALALLLATAATPAFAAPREEEERSKPRAERSERAQPRAERREERRERAEPRAEKRERPIQRRHEPSVQERPEPVIERIQRRSRPEIAPALPSRESRRPDRRAEPAVEPAGDSVRDWRSVERRRDDSPTTIERRNLRRAPPVAERDGQLVEPRRPLPPVLDRDSPGRDGRNVRVGRVPLPGTQAPEPETAQLERAQPRHRWRGDWRRDRRFDWRDHRRRHRNLFRLSIYFDPFGWRYHRYNIGWRLWPNYYSSRYWLDDPWMYRLPPAYGPYRWIRYYDDALLVNIYTGRVVDVIHDFFW